MSRSKLAKKQEEIQFYKARCFKLKQQRETLKQELERAQQRAKSASQSRDYLDQEAGVLRNNLNSTTREIDRLKRELERKDRTKRYVPYDLCEEMSMTREDLMKLPEYSYSFPELKNHERGFRWRRNMIPPSSPYHGIADEWVVGELTGSFRSTSSTSSITWYKVNIEG